MENLLKKVLKLEQELHSEKSKRDVPIFRMSVSGSPTTNGYIVVEINGRQYKIMTTA